MAAGGRVAAALVAALLLLAGCAQSQQAEPASPPPQIIDSVAYAPSQPAGSAGHLLDLYLPADVTKPVPLIIWSEGNAWLADNGGASASQWARIFIPRGYAVAGVNIRSSRQVTFPGQLSDLKAAIRFLRANAKRFHLDPRRFGAVGDSSAGWAVEMAAVTGDVPSLDGNVGVAGVSSSLQAAAAFYAPTDLMRADQDLAGSCGAAAGGPCSSGADVYAAMLGCPLQDCPTRAAAANPITYVSAVDPPLLLFHGEQDALVPWQESLLLFQAVERVNGRAELVLLPVGMHGQALAFLADPAVNSGAQSQSTDHGRDTLAHPVSLSPAYLVAFFDRYLRR